MIPSLRHILKPGQILMMLLAVIMPYRNPAQDVTSSSGEKAKNGTVNREIKGLVLDSANQSALPYASLFLLNQKTGAITNENGYFTLDITGSRVKDTLCIQYIGYETKRLIIGQLDTFSVIILAEKIYDLNETLVFGNPPDPLFIVKQVIKTKEVNYKKTSFADQIFLREREITDFDKFNLNYKKSTIPELDEEKLKLLEENIPKNTTSYTDFLGEIYLTKIKTDSGCIKIDPIRMVSLKEKDIEELDQFETLFENLVKSTDTNEYWKLKSGVFSQKIDNSDTVSEIPKDSIPENSRNVANFAQLIDMRFSYSTLSDDGRWEFLYETGKYHYTLVGGTSFNGENVYIIDFKPGRSGHFIGRLYISVETYALIRADYEYAPGKTGRDIHLLGIGYTETRSDGSIYFEKKNDYYLPKYFSWKEGFSASVNRNVEISKKKQRLLFDKELMDFDLELDISIREESSVEFYMINNREISDEEFSNFHQKAYMEVIYVDQFDDNLWNGYSIIEPTKQMREYKKQ